MLGLYKRVRGVTQSYGHPKVHVLKQKERTFKDVVFEQGTSHSVTLGLKKKKTTISTLKGFAWQASITGESKEGIVGKKGGRTDSDVRRMRFRERQPGRRIGLRDAKAPNRDLSARYQKEKRESRRLWS